MFKFGKAALYERLLREKDRQNDMLAEQIDYLRARVASLESTTAPLIGTSFRAAPEPDAPRVEVKNHVSDEELDVQAMLAAGAITKDEVGPVLEALGMVPELEFESVG